MPAITPLLTSKEFSCLQGLLVFENEKYVVSHLLSGQGPAPLSIILLLIFWSFCPQGMNSSAHPGEGPSTSCLSYSKASKHLPYGPPLLLAHWTACFFLAESRQDLRIFLNTGRKCQSIFTHKDNTCNAGYLGSIPGSGRVPWSRTWQPTPVSLPGQSHRHRSLAGCNVESQRVRHD